MSINMKRVALQGARLSFANDSLWKPKPYQEGDTPRYSASFILNPNDPECAESLKELRAYVQHLLREKAASNKSWATDWAGTLPQPNWLTNYCLRDGNLKNWDGYPGNLYVAAHRGPEMRPRVLNARGGDVHGRDEFQAPYDGCYVIGYIKPWVQDNRNGKGINAELLGVQFYRDGTPFGGGGAALGDDDLIIPDDAFGQPASDDFMS